MVSGSLIDRAVDLSALAKDRRGSIGVPLNKIGHVEMYSMTS